MADSIVLEKWDRMKRGERVVMSPSQLDDLDRHFNVKGGADADLYFRCAASVMNPRNVGTKDVYVAFLKGCEAPQKGGTAA